MRKYFLLWFRSTRCGVFDGKGDYKQPLGALGVGVSNEVGCWIVGDCSPIRSAATWQLELTCAKSSFAYGRRK